MDRFTEYAKQTGNGVTVSQLVKVKETDNLPYFSLSIARSSPRDRLINDERQLMRSIV